MKSISGDELPGKVAWQEANGHKYLLMDMQYCSEERRIELSRIIIPMIKKEVIHTVRIIANVRHTTISLQSMRTVQKDWIDALPYFDRVAMIGVNGAKSMLFKIWGFLTNMKVKRVQSTEEAIAYLCR